MDASKKARTWLPLTIGVSIAAGILIGTMLSRFNRPSMALRGTAKLNAVLNYINHSYVDTIDMPVLIENTLPQLLHQLDPHSNYISAAEMKRVDEDLEGHFSGIGVSFFVLRDTIVVTGIIPGGPSEAAGIKPWDRIVSVDDSLMVGEKLNNELVMKSLRGARGTTTKLEIYRDGKALEQPIVVTRGDIPKNSVLASYMLTDNIGFIKIGTFAFTTFNEFISAISKLKNEGANSFVIDLRGNFGGSLEAVIAMVNEFLDKGDLIVYAEGRSFPREDRRANGSGSCKKDNVVVLIDEMSASASEIFAGAIQDNDRGLILGRRSFGKGLVQSQRKFNDGSAVRLTVARYYTPSGRSIQRKYERGKYDEYEMNAVNRYIQGDYENIDTTLNLLPYKTVSGRQVFGGDGIMPDIFIPRDTLGINSYYTSLANRNYIQEYAMTYSDMHRKQLSQFSTWREMYHYLKQQPLVLNLTSYADHRGIRRRPYYIEESFNLMEKEMCAFIIRNFFDEEGFYSVWLRNDIVLNKSIQLLDSNKVSPEAIANEEYSLN